MGLFNGLSYNGLNNGLQSSHFSGLANGLIGTEHKLDTDAFISIWNTRNLSTGSSNNRQIRLPLVATGTYNFVVEWGDGTRDIIRAFNAAAVTHTYHTAGNYTVKIRGTFTSMLFNAGTTDTNKILEIVQWGCFKPLDSYTFNSCINLRCDRTTDILDLSTAANTSIAGLFQFCTMPTISRIGEIDLSRITGLSYMFQQNPNFNDWSINQWDTSNISSIIAIFQNCTTFNQPLDNWNLSNLNSTQGAFQGATSFNQDLGNWNLPNVITMASTFNGATTFNNGGSPMISGWTTSAVTSMNGMFTSSSAFNQPIGSWNVSNVTDMNSMFFTALAFNQPLSGWNVSKVANMGSMFSNANAFDQNIGNWNVSACTNFTLFMATKTPATFSTANLDAIYNGWTQRLIQPNNTISFGTAKYTAAGAEGKALLTRANFFLNVTNCAGVAGIGTAIVVTLSATHGLVTGNKVFVSGVLGTTEANGPWLVNVISPTQVILNGSTFANNYISGGQFRTGYGWTITDGGI
jgi:surface protein